MPVLPNTMRVTPRRFRASAHKQARGSPWLTFSYTGMAVKYPDGWQFHGIGIVPDVIVPVTAEDLRDGIDRDILATIGLLDLIASHTLHGHR